MDKKCYVCGKTIQDGELYYNIGPNSFVCGNNKCFEFYFWDNLATKMVHNKWHKYAIIDRKVYQIGSDDDDPCGFGGKYWVIQFNDGTYVETNSLWYKGELPERLQHDFPDNAVFVKKGY